MDFGCIDTIFCIVVTKTFRSSFGHLQGGDNKNTFLTFIGLCIVIYSYNTANEMYYFSNLF